jgi:hypothetical protein
MGGVSSNALGDEAEKLEKASVIGKAVAEATCEVISEQKPEILKRAKAKLVSQGLSVEDAEIEPQIS